MSRNNEWQRTTREVLYWDCFLCCRRVEEPMEDEDGATRNAHPHLLNHSRVHFKVAHQKELEYRAWQPFVAVDTVDDEAPTDLSDIISDAQMRRLGRLLNRDEGYVFGRLCELLAKEAKFVCPRCKRQITSVQAARSRGGRCASSPPARASAGATTPGLRLVSRRSQS